MSLTDERKKSFILTCLFWTVVIGMLFVLFKYVLPWILPFLIGFSLASIANFFAKKLLKLVKIPLKLGSAIVTLLVLIIFAAITTLLGYEIYKQIAKFITDRVIEGDLVSQITLTFSNLIAKIPEKFQSSANSLVVSFVSGFGSTLTKFVTSAVGAAPGISLGTVITIIASFIFSGDYGRVTDFIKLQLPDRIKQIIPGLNTSMKTSLGKLFRAYLLIILITFTELTIGLTILGEPYAIAIAAITAFIDILPVFGTGFILWPWAVISLINGRYLFALGLMILYFVILIIRQIIEPKLVGQSIEVHPIVTLMAMYIGAKIMGGIGFFVFPISIVIIKNLQDNGYISLWKPLPKSDSLLEKIGKRRTKKPPIKPEDGDKNQ
ncbi:MAG TPA: sporulation integral membrane protein YtvI [Oscillospiraceae bacterium]|nr:sporulation integral membrane protein YtvI [Oscillospiraceae bacterium]HPF56437.1 sporulation integral membrane protein YtvI [Clostridiales bacterium]HPK35566.1 sporulation integral membrane protein YtvI [Oscillospiraceae bacterium]HPR75897.1 sporulation integral membrane protein YtvI [Oscillospiraceae bacterium]